MMWVELAFGISFISCAARKVAGLFKGCPEIFSLALGIVAIPFVLLIAIPVTFVAPEAGERLLLWLL
jgi:hypothetical protein